MPAQVCPVCSKLYDGQEDHPRDPCNECWKQHWRVDSCGNVYQLDMSKRYYIRPPWVS